MSSTPLATAFVQIRGRDGGLAADVSRMAMPAASAGGDGAGRKFAESFSSSVQGGLRSAQGGFTQQGSESGARFSDAFKSSTGNAGPGVSGQFRKFAAGAAGVFVAAFAAAGIAQGLSEVFSDAIDIEAGRAKLQVQLGATAQDSKRYGQIAGDLYADAYGGSIGDVNDAISSVVRNIGSAATGSDADLSRISGSVLNLSSTFEQDLGGSTRAVGQLLKTGLAGNAQEALDILTRGFQTGGDASEDLLDTFTEYPAKFKQLGLSGEQAMGLINQGLQAGARNSDLVADALKEFQIRATDGSTTSAAGFKALGLNAKDMTEQIARGGKGASDGLQLVLDRLRGIKDPAKRSQAAIKLFGTQAEDLGDSLLKLDPSKAVKGLGQVSGAAERMNDALGDTASSRIESFKRLLSQGLTDAAGAALGGLEGLYDLLGKGDFTAKFGQAFHVEEDSPVVGFLLGVRQGVEGVSAAIQLLVTGDFTGGIGKALGVEEDSPLVGSLLTIRGGIEGIFGLIRLMATGQFTGAISKGLGIEEDSPLVADLLSIRDTISQFVTQVGVIFGQVSAAVIAGIGPVMPYVRQAFGSLKQIIGDVIGIIATIVRNQLAAMQALWRVFGPSILAFIGPAMRAIGTVIAGVLQVIAGITRTVLALLRGDWSGVASGIKQIVTGLGQVILGVWRATMATSRLLVSAGMAALRALFSAMVSAVKARVSEAADAVRGLGSKIQDTVSGWGSLLVQAGRNILSGLISGIREKIGDLTSMMGKVAGIVTGHWEHSPAKYGPLKKHPMAQAGRNVISNLAEGLAETSRLDAALAVISGRVGGVAGTPGAGRSAGGAAADMEMQAKLIGAEVGAAVTDALAKARREVVLDGDAMTGAIDRHLGWAYG